MNLQVANKLEVNLLNAKTTPQYLSEFVIRHKVPAIVSSPEYIAPLIAHRAVMSGSYRIICALDFPHGSNYAMDKLFRANPDFVGADGFEILLSSSKTEIESRNEMRSIHGYLKANRPLADIRWCLRMHSSSEKEVEGILKNMKGFPPSYVRLDPHVEDLGQDVNKIKTQIAQVRKHVPYAIKISGGIDLLKFQELSKEKGVKRFDVSFEQAEAIVRALKLKALEDIPTIENKEESAVKQTGTADRIRLS